MTMQIRFAFLLLLLVGLGMPMASGEEEVSAPAPPADFELRGEAAAGKPVYLKKCALCHGENGNGVGKIKIDPPARDLRDRERMSQRSDWEIYVVIRDGGKVLGLSELMLPWGGQVSDQDLHDLTAFVRTLGEDEAE